MKAIFLTMTLTIATLSFAVTLFLNTILGVFGLVTTSVEKLHELQSSQKVVQQMKEKHKVRKANVTKNFTKRSARKVSSSMLAAATIGTVAVATTVAGFEVYDYCEEQKSLQEDSNILYGTTVEFNFKQCLKESKDDFKEILVEVKKSATESVTNAINSTAEYSSEKWLAVKESSAYVFESTGEATNELWGSTKEWFTR